MLMGGFPGEQKIQDSQPTAGFRLIEKLHGAWQGIIPQTCHYPPAGNGAAGRFVSVMAGELVA